jgi:hypothetical protein
MTGLATRTIRIWSAVTVALALLLAAIPLVLFPNAGANDGAGPMTAVFGIPMVATGVLIHLALLRRGETPWVVGLLPWVIGLVFGVLFLMIPAALADPQYYTSETLGGMLATLAGIGFIAILGAACGIVLWFLLLVPAASLVLSVGQAWRGESVRPALVAIPATILAVEVFVVVITVALNVEEPQDLVVVQVAGALFGLVDLFPPTPDLGLWIVRALVVATLVAGVLLTVTREPPRPETPPN